MQKRLGWCSLSVMLAVAGCDSPAAVVSDAGPQPDTGAVDSGHENSDGGGDTDAGLDGGIPATGCELTGYPDLDLAAVHTFSDLPVAMATAPGRGELFIVLRAGEIWIMDPATGDVGAAPFADVGGLLGGTPSGQDEWGLLGLAFHPDYATNGLFYVAYTADAGAAYMDHVAFGTRSAANPDQAEATFTDIFTVEDPRSNHNGGILQFGPDGFLYYGLGDGGEQGDPSRRGQDLDIALGKVHRFRVGPGIATYEIPESNPFADGAGGLATIWAYGFRNPWRFTFDRATGDLYIADVGQNEWEEISVAASGTGAGDNFGWSVCEGTHDFNGTCADLADHHAPIFEYAHDDGDWAGGGSGSIAGGYVYRGSAIPGLAGAYLFADTTSGVIGALRHCGTETREPTPLASISGLCNVTTFGEDTTGELYVACYGSNQIARVVAP